jgi:hypothetical protein
MGNCLRARGKTRDFPGDVKGGETRSFWCRSHEGE